MTNNKLTDEQLQEIYGEAVSCEVAEKNGAYILQIPWLTSFTQCLLLNFHCGICRELAVHHPL